jgi:hypothetical protein
VRGLLNTLALSSVVLEVVNNGVSGMSFNVMLFGLNGLFKLFVPCFYGSLVETCSEKMARNFYEIEWPQMGREERRGFLILQQNLCKSLKVKAIGMVEINLMTLVGILQWTYSMYATISVVEK